MIIKSLQDRSSLMHELVTIWEDSVLATHLFLSDNDIKTIKTYVPQAIYEVEYFVVGYDSYQRLVGFMGIQNQKLEMLFLSPQMRGKGIGKQFIEYALKNYHIQELTVNEQNSSAIGFYEHMGFSVYRRSDRDEQGQPYPLLYMKYTKSDKEKLLLHCEKIHTTPLGSERIKRNLHIKEDVVKYCIKKITDSKSVVYQQGKNYYCESDGIKITINAHSLTIITAHLLK